MCESSCGLATIRNDNFLHLGDWMIFKGGGGSHGFQGNRRGVSHRLKRIKGGNDSKIIVVFYRYRRGHGFKSRTGLNFF